MIKCLRGFTASSLVALLLISAAAGKDTQYIYGTSIDGVTQLLAVDRNPALYTQNFGDCLGGHGLFTVTKFDAAYYTDNSTVLFHLDGQSAVHNESLMIHISMDAYGENRFQMTFDPCNVNINSLCPLNASVPVTAWVVFPVGPRQVGDIPSLAFTVPDFEGSVRLQIFGNTTRSEIGCFQASLTNGKTTGYPQIISPILATFVLVAMLASIATAAYGDSTPASRTHYAHSLSVMLMFETFQTVFFSGALQLSFPSVLPAWWSNFAWAAGQIYSESVVRTAGTASGIHGNVSQVGDNSSSFQLFADNGASLAQQIYGQTSPGPGKMRSQLFRRYNASDPYDYTWAGIPVNPGVALPGTWTGFSGTLAALNIPAADTFAVGLVWFLVLLLILTAGLTAAKFLLEILVKLKRIREDRLAYFRGHWMQYTVLICLRTFFAAFAMIMTLAFYEFSASRAAGAKALAAVFFLLFLFGVGGLAAHACYARLKGGRYLFQSDRIVFVRGTVCKIVPYIFMTRLSALDKSEVPRAPFGSIPFAIIKYNHDDSTRASVHEDEPYIKKYGWLSARYRRTRWWFFAFYLGYHLFRAAIVGGGSGTPKAQVSCLLIYDLVAFLVILSIDPFEGRRNTALAVWMLGLSKILTTALSIAFLPSLNVNRIIATVIGIIIIVIQGFLTIGVLVLVVLGAFSSYMSLTRNRDAFSPEELKGLRTHYLEHVEKTAPDVRLSKADKERLKKEAALAAASQEPSFNVRSVRRVTKIYDEYDATVVGLNGLSESITPGHISMAKTRPNRYSIYSTHSLPRAARPYRASWKSEDFKEWDAVSLQRPESGLAKRLSSYSGYALNLDRMLEEDGTASFDGQEATPRMSGANTSPEPDVLTPVSSKPSSTTAVRSSGADGESMTMRKLELGAEGGYDISESDDGEWMKMRESVGSFSATTPDGEGGDGGSESDDGEWMRIRDSIDRLPVGINKGSPEIPGPDGERSRTRDSAERASVESPATGTTSGEVFVDAREQASLRTERSETAMTEPLVSR